MLLKNQQHLGGRTEERRRSVYSFLKKQLCENFSLPGANPVSVTTSHPDHASYKLFVISHADSFFLLLI
jgi:hypothetical protein